MVNWQHKGGLDSRLTTEVDYTDISDPYYFQDLQSDQIGVERTDWINQQGALTYRGDNYTARLNAQAYKLATVADITPYNRMPQITFNGALPYHPGGLDFTYNSEIVRFERDLRTGTFINEDGFGERRIDNNVTGLARANGNRLNLEPGVALPLNWNWGFVRPSLKYMYTQYDLDLDSQGKNSLLADERFSSSQNRGVPIASIDSGLYFDRDTQMFGTNFRQTLEQRLFYLYVPE